MAALIYSDVYYCRHGGAPARGSPSPRRPRSARRRPDFHAAAVLHRACNCRGRRRLGRRGLHAVDIHRAGHGHFFAGLENASARQASMLPWPNRSSPSFSHASCWGKRSRGAWRRRRPPASAPACWPTSGAPDPWPDRQSAGRRPQEEAVRRSRANKCSYYRNFAPRQLRAAMTA